MFWSWTSPLPKNELAALMMGRISDYAAMDRVVDHTNCFEIESDAFLDCRATYNPDNSGIWINDGFDKKLNNVYAQFVRLAATGSLLPYVRILAKRQIKPGQEIFMEYGKQYWLWYPNFKTLPTEQAKKCVAYYKIEANEFHYPVEEEPAKKKKAKK